MSEFSLHDVLAAEKKAGEKLAEARRLADGMRAQTEKRIAELDKEVNSRIEAKRRARMEEAEREAAGAREATISEAEKAILDWEAKYRERRESIIAQIAAILTGKTEA